MSVWSLTRNEECVFIEAEDLVTANQLAWSILRVAGRRPLALVDRNHRLELVLVERSTQPFVLELVSR